jgi:hypothetical protein
VVLAGKFYVLTRGEEFGKRLESVPTEFGLSEFKNALRPCFCSLKLALITTKRKSGRKANQKYYSGNPTRADGR